MQAVTGDAIPAQNEEMQLWFVTDMKSEIEIDGLEQIQWRIDNNLHNILPPDPMYLVVVADGGLKLGVLIVGGVCVLMASGSAGGRFCSDTDVQERGRFIK